MSDTAPVLERVRQFFRDYARAIQHGGPEYVRSERFLNVFWPADEFILIQLVADGQIDQFYEEAQAALLASLGPRGADVAPILSDAVDLPTNALDKLAITIHVPGLLPRGHSLHQYVAGTSGDHAGARERSDPISHLRSDALGLMSADYADERRFFLWIIGLRQQLFEFFCR